jgi:N-acetylglucosamine-6-phosphate deacetylase
MMKAYLGARIFDGQEWRDGSALLVEEGVIAGICAEREIAGNVETVDLGGGMLVPGFVDL